MSTQVGRLEQDALSGVQQRATDAPSRSARQSSWTVAVFAIALVAICGLAVRAGIAPLRLFEHDTFFLIDNGYRVAQGQVPHRDFSSAWGPATFLIEAAGLRLAGMRPAGVGYASAWLAAVLGIWTFWIGRRLCSPLSGCLLAIFSMLLITAPFSLGYGATNFSHAMVYNRYGYAILGIVLLECVTSAIHLNSGRAFDLASAVSTGVAFGLLGSLKVSYAAMAVPFLLVSLVFGQSRRQRLLAICCGGAVVGAAMLCYLRFDVADMVRDLLMAASGRSKTWRAAEMLTPGAGQLSETICLVMLAILAGDGIRTRARNLFLALLTLVVGGILLSTNHQASGWPLNAFAATVLAMAAVRRFRSARPARGKSAPPDPMVLFSVVLAAFCLLPLSFLNGISLVAAVDEERAPEMQTFHLLTARGSQMTFEPVSQVVTTATGGAAYVAAVNDGLSLLQRRTGDGDGVLTLDQMNPFNYLLERPSPTGGMAAAAFNYVFSDARHLTADQYFGNARYVMVRKYSRDAADYATETYFIGGLQRIYEPLLQERFRLVEETPHWRLYGR